jgi:transposase
MSKQKQLDSLLDLGWSERRIAGELKIHRMTVRRYAEARRSKCTKTPTDPAPTASSVRRRPFLAAPFRDEILPAVKLGDSAQVIYQHLVEVHHYTGSYDSVKRYVRHLKRSLPKRAVGVMHHAPGEEAQVDYFRGGLTRHPDTGEYKRPWVFRMTLCHSRHGYEEPIWTLDLPSFLRLHEAAFREFGGVVEVVRHDNMAAGVSRACFHDPDSNAKYLAFAQHWGFTPLPTRPYSPTENGKQERAGGYCKHNAYRKDQRFESLEEHRLHLRRWNERWARTRVHGTTRKQVYTHFLETDLPALRPCPAQDFPLFECGTRKVHIDGHVEVNGAFYPVSSRWIGESVHVRWDEHLVRIFCDEVEVALHARVEPGRWALRPGHDPAELNSTQLARLDWLKRRCSEVGPELRRWAEAAHEERGIRTFKLLQGVLALARKHTRAQMLRAATTALHQRSLRYAAFLQLVQRPAPAPPERSLISQHPAIRPMSQYTLGEFLPQASHSPTPGDL